MGERFFMKDMRLHINVTADTEDVEKQIKELQKMLDDMSFRVRMEKEKEEREARRRFIEKFNEIKKRNDEIKLKNSEDALK